MAFRVYIPVLGFKQLGTQLSEERVFALQQELFSGCTPERDAAIRLELISSALKLAFVIASRFAAFRKTDREELAEVAWLEVCECTFRLEQLHPNYYAYIHRSVGGTLRNYFKSSHTVWIPRSQYKPKGPTATEEVQPLCATTEYSEETPICNGKRNLEFDNTILEDYLNSGEFTPYESAILRGRLQGHLDEEIALQLGVSRSFVTKARMAAGKKFRQIMKGI